MRKNKRRGEREDSSESGPQIRISERLSTAILAVIIVAMAVTLIVIVWQRSTTPALTDYEGTIVDRWADYAETDQGSRPRLNLLIEVDGGKRFTVRVNSTVYESAKIGMRVKSTSGQIVLIDSGQRANGK